MKKDMNTESPILVVKYNPVRVLWRLIIPNGLVILVSSSLLFGSELSLAEDGFMKYWFGILFFGILFIIGVILSTEIILMKEFRFYKEHMEKEWYLLGIKSEKYTNIKIMGMNSMFWKIINFFYINKPSFFNWKFCSCDMHLINKNNRQKIKDVLSKVSSRSIDEFNKSEIKLNPFVNNNHKA